MKNQTLELQMLEQESEKAIKNGYQFPGFLGCAPDEFTKEELIMLLNVMYKELKGTNWNAYSLSSFLSIPPSK